jgi:ubiquitin carboxyl-terminal hydrolase 34
MTAKQNFVSHSIQVLVAFLTSDELFDSLSGNSITTMLASRAVECLLLAISGMSSTHLSVSELQLTMSSAPSN